ncbi:SDR family NAD(P)-dependent oxidoreductase [Nocardia sp. NPDC006044]|uniref:SDR family NAD(P)-dependent oxidoreductase n=1 Tax=Nocardia sp. NPDC006044 TaxID=3364306 RepID=UPI0036770F6A
MSEDIAGDGRGRGAWAVVAGATGGVGRETALRLAEDGYSIVVCGRDGAGAEETRKLIEWTGGRAVDLVVDLGDIAAVRRLITETAGVVAGAPVEVLVNNAGEADYGSTGDLFDLVFNRNVKAPLVLTGAFAPLMVERGRGAIVNVGGFGALAGDGGQVQAAKAALIMLTKVWAAEYGPDGVRVNFVDLGHASTAVRARRAELDPGCPHSVPPGGGGPVGIAEAIRFLVSPRAAGIQAALLAMTGVAGMAERLGCLSAPA